MECTTTFRDLGDQQVRVLSGEVLGLPVVCERQTRRRPLPGGEPVRRLYYLDGAKLPQSLRHLARRTWTDHDTFLRDLAQVARPNPDR